MYDLGSVVPIVAELEDANGNSANATSVVLTIGLPDGTIATPAVTNPPATVGKYQVDHVTAQAGRHTVRWAFTGPSAALTDVFVVRESASRQLLSLADAKAVLNKSGAVDDDELRFFINGATAAIEGKIGPVVRRTLTERHTVHVGDVLELNKYHVLGVTSVTFVDDGTVAIAPADLDIDGPRGRLRAKDGGRLPCGRLEVAYTVGRVVIDEAIIEAAGLIVKHNWETQRGGKARPQWGAARDGSEKPTEAQRYSRFAIPAQAAELLHPFEPTP